MKCKYDRKCDYEYLEVRCTIKDCKDINYFGKPKGNGLIVLLYNHKKQIIFQWASCHSCIFPIGYLTVENKIKRDFDSKKIKIIIISIDIFLINL